MAEQKVELRKIRDFSQNIGDTFLFIKQNFKPLMISFLTIAGVFLLAGAIVSGINQGNMGGNLWEEVMAGRSGRSRISLFEILNGTYFLAILLTWLGVTAMHVVIISYMKLYEEKQNQSSTTAEVWEVFKKYFLQVLIYTIPIYLLIAAGFVFCLLPGIYLAVVLLPFSTIIIIEDASFGTAFSRCFEIIKENFWVSLGIYFIVYLIYGISSSIISLAIGAVFGGVSYFTTENVSTTYGVIMGVAQALTFVFAVVFYVSAVLHYFTLTEKYEGTGILKRLNNLGSAGANFNNIDEQY
jgi:hypothetical protein